MTNYYATGRTNYFAVKDAEAFKREIDSWGTSLSVISQDTEINGETTLFAILGDGEFGFAWGYYNEDAGDDITIEWDKFFQKHLKEDWVAIIMEAGAEGKRYINGFALAFNNKGETKEIGINQIYDLATSLGGNITRAEW